MSGSDPQPTGRRRHAISAAIFLLFGMLVLDGLPEINRGHKILKQRMDVVVDKTGLWQGSWKLFAPNVRKMNVAVSAVIVYEDGSKRYWDSPDWTRMSGFQKFRWFRLQEYIDDVRTDSNRAAWPGLGAWLAREYPKPQEGGDSPVKEVRLTRHWGDVPKPTKEAHQPKPDRLPMPEKYLFHTWKPGQSKKPRRPSKLNIKKLKSKAPARVIAAPKAKKLAPGTVAATPAPGTPPAAPPGTEAGATPKPAQEP